jgi:hypothetical protein
MRICLPDRWWRQLKKAIEERQAPLDPTLKKLYDVAVGITRDEMVQYAIDLIEVPEDREVLTAYFLSGATLVEISSSLRIPEDVLSLFSWLAIDMSEFRNKLEIRRYAEEFSQTASVKGQKLISLGIVQGPAALEYHYLHGRETLDVKREEVAKELLSQAYFNGRLARGNSLVSEHAKESLKWTSAAAKALELVESLNISTNKDDDALEAVRKRVVTKTAEEAGIPAIEH